MPGGTVTEADSKGRLTEAWTPSSLPSFFSTRLTQDAQVMPSMSSSTTRTAGPRRSSWLLMGFLENWRTSRLVGDDQVSGFRHGFPDFGGCKFLGGGDGDSGDAAGVQFNVKGLPSRQGPKVPADGGNARAAGHAGDGVLGGGGGR